MALRAEEKNKVNNFNHAFDILYSRLDEEVKRNIHNIHLEFMRNSKLEYSLEEFNGDLRKHSNTFRRWRNFHEHETGKAQIPFIYTFLEVLKQYAVAKK